MPFWLTFHIKLVSFKNIDISLIYGLKSTKFRAYAHILAYGLWLITQSFFPNPNKNLYTSSGDY